MCRSGIVYAANVSSQSLTFEVGTLWRGNIVMRDRETGSIWQQATGEALIGPLAGASLEPLGGELARWAVWRKEHPDTVLAVDPPRRPRGILPKRVVESVVKIVPAKIALPGLTGRDGRLLPHAEIAGIRIGGEACAYPVSTLKQRRVINDELGGTPIALVYDTDSDLVRAFQRSINGRSVKLVFENGMLLDKEKGGLWGLRGEPVNGAARGPLEPIAVTRQWWHGWSEFHPRTGVYSAQSDP